MFCPRGSSGSPYWDPASRDKLSLSNPSGGLRVSPFGVPEALGGAAPARGKSPRPSFPHLTKLNRRPRRRSLSTSVIPLPGDQSAASGRELLAPDVRRRSSQAVRKLPGLDWGGGGEKGKEVQSGHLTSGAANSAAQISDALGEGLERFFWGDIKEELEFLQERCSQTLGCALVWRRVEPLDGLRSHPAPGFGGLSG